MRRAAAVGALAALCACAPGRSLPELPPPPFAAAPTPEAANPNFELIVSATVPNPDADGFAFAKVVVDGKDMGQTPLGRKSEEKRLRLRLPAGNQPVRVEYWVLAGTDWKRLDDGLQPRERFVRIEDSSIARLTLRFAENEASHTLSLSR